jgi:hypothetical protein
MANVGEHPKTPRMRDGLVRLKPGGACGSHVFEWLSGQLEMR